MPAERIYRHLPAWSQNWALSAAGLTINHRRYGGDYRRIETEVCARSRWDQARTLDFRDQRLRGFVLDACQSSPFWRARFAAADLHPSEVRSLADLAALPVLDKADVQAAVDAIGSQDNHGPLQTCHTSGSTGSGLVFPATRKALQEQWAVWWRYRQWHGLSRKHWCGYFGGRPIVPGPARQHFWRKNHAARQVMFSTWHMNETNLPAYVDALRRMQLPWLHGYPSALSLMADAVLAAGGDLGYAVDTITCGAENLTPRQSRNIAAAFGVAPRQHYGMAEAVANISECPAGRLHVDEDFAAVEFLSDPHGGPARVVGTNLSNPAFPLIRYAVGDLAATGEHCDCGRPGRIVASLDGRMEDFLLLADGSRVGRLDHIFKDMTHIAEAQFQQRRPGHARLRIVPGRGFDAGQRQQLQATLDDWFGTRCQIEIEYVERIARTASGKLRLVISEPSESTESPT